MPYNLIERLPVCDRFDTFVPPRKCPGRPSLALRKLRGQGHRAVARKRAEGRRLRV